MTSHPADVPGSMRYPPDHLSTLPSRELQQIMRDAETLPLDALINHGAMSVDYGAARVWRDSYWKGSFAKDTLLGWEERRLTPIRRSGAQYTGGRFWKRFDEVGDGEVRGFVVNYGLSFLPGRPVVTACAYPDASRPYARGGDTVLVLRYVNQPYRVVYDVIKVVDPDNCIGVMHLGEFPRGRVFGTFVMARSNHPFQKMSVPDHDAIFTSDHAVAPRPSDLEASWRGHVVFSRQPELNLHHQFNPPLVRLDVREAGGALEARMRVGLVRSTSRVEFRADEVVLAGRPGRQEHIRRLDDGTLIGRRTTGESATVTRRYVLTRLLR